jgi:hypothetical protein
MGDVVPVATQWTSEELWDRLRQHWISRDRSDSDFTGAASSSISKQKYELERPGVTPALEAALARTSRRLADTPAARSREHHSHARPQQSPLSPRTRMYDNVHRTTTNGRQSSKPVSGHGGIGVGELNMQSIDVETWEQFEEELKTRDISIGDQYLFRGQGNSRWALDTTLERHGQRDKEFAEYYRLISVIRPQVETFTGTTWGALPSVPDVNNSAQEYDKFSLMLDGIYGGFPAYSYMAYLRHHGFPSPLLDWSRTPYVAAYFAFRHADKERVAIYVYLERAGSIKGWSSDESQIHTLGPYVQTHRRHFLQQSTYTICLRFRINTGWYFAPHESVFSRNVPNQDVLWKFTIPATERTKVLKVLDSYNLNAFSLFDSNEALMETMALRHIDFKQTVA